MPILFSRAIGPIPVSVIETEAHDSTIEITKIPIEDGSSITDHAYRNPNRVTLDVTSDAAVATYGALKALQESREPFVLITGLYVYRNMLIKALSPERNSSFSSVFRGKVVLQEAILVGTTYVAGAGASGMGAPGGVMSTRAAAPAFARSAGLEAARRATAMVARGDNRTTIVGINAAFAGLL
ncbi:hypothetical protein CSC94_12755 [Zhengella mangrovi]|uniref:Dit-like phage tail protein N-terminal domain-containing protein n=1 Tax=Zhengella mangrovi TaxID=1982044 RepID=A0A2G1QM02_9HYPH|nr:hypothetical protein [Zhengella mangrovi]PHP66553.1 hypothetical protein CSC94_12755 [Zhengella mangrovi]